MLNEFHRKLFDTIENNSYIETFADPAREVLFVDHYAYSIAETGLTLTNTLQDFTLTMDSDSDFVAVFASGTGSRPGNNGIQVFFNPAILVQVRELWSGKTWFNIPSLLPLVAGVGGYPFIMPSPRVIPARSQVVVQAGAAHPSATFSQFNFTLHGGRIFYK